ncbi:hypothetical protein DFH27DRAFT_131161 [Peziza echinospora]|nr:hypothetical protein DFH27DRAFT_131161 [Peziza echinospora]
MKSGRTSVGPVFGSGSVLASKLFVLIFHWLNINGLRVNPASIKGGKFFLQAASSEIAAGRGRGIETPSGRVWFRFNMMYRFEVEAEESKTPWPAVLLTIASARGHYLWNSTQIRDVSLKVPGTQNESKRIQVIQTLFLIWHLDSGLFVVWCAACLGNIHHSQAQFNYISPITCFSILITSWKVVGNIGHAFSSFRLQEEPCSSPTRSYLNKSSQVHRMQENPACRFINIHTRVLYSCAPKRACTHARV